MDDILYESYMQNGGALLEALTRFQSLAYILAAVLFILALAGLSKQEKALLGNTLGACGMGIALLATIVVSLVSDASDILFALIAILVALAIGAAIGIWKAKRIAMTAMPELVAMLHSFVGAAAVLVGYNSFLTTPGSESLENAYHMGEVGLAVFIGAVTFTGSIVAWLKLSGRLSGKPVCIPGKNAINAAVLVCVVVCIAWFMNTQGIQGGVAPLCLVTVLSLVLGAHLVLAIGGGDMPVVVSMLNSYSGWAAAMAGFTLGNDLLIITGALVGSSGAYLSYIMCKGMNRSFISVILGGFGEGSGAVSPSATDDLGDVTTTNPEAVARLLGDSKRVVIAPGYGMAVAQAQFPIADLSHKLQSRGVDIKFAIHPVAGRMPGHMNVLLAEAKVPYESVYEMDEVNDEFSDVDLVLVVGANDTVNPSAQTDSSSPIAGMPVLRVWEAGKVVVLKRSMGTGYSGVQNPLFFNDNTDMLLGDAKESVESIIASL